MKIKNSLLVISTLLLFSSQTFSQTSSDFLLQPPKVYDTDLLGKDFYKGRRDLFASKLNPKSIAVFFANDVRNRINDTDFRYRQNNSLYYLTGLTEENSAFIFVPDSVKLSADSKPVTTILFVQNRDPQRETWTGRRLGVEGAMSILGIDTAFTNEQFGDVLTKIAQAQFRSRKVENIYSPYMTETVEEKELRTMVSAFKDFRDQYHSWITFLEPDKIIREMRSIKTPEEIALMKKAIGISADGHLQMMKSAEPNMYEFEVQAVGEYIFTRSGAEYVGYNSICGSGENSVILHYETDRKQVKDGEVLLIDMAAEYHGYSADITRTFPINGKWSKEQLALYNIVLKAQQAGIDAIKPGVKISDVSTVITDVLAQGLLDLGLIKEKSAARRYTIHGYMHGIGLDVHDPAPSDGTFKPNYFTTVEPGIYIPEGSPVDKKWWNIGIRIEDDVMVTETGNLNLSANVPRDPKEIEKLMSKKGIGNFPVDYSK